MVSNPSQKEILVRASEAQEMLLEPVRRRNQRFGKPTFDWNDGNFDQMLRRQSLRSEDQITIEDAEQMRKRLLEVGVYAKEQNKTSRNEATVLALDNLLKFTKDEPLEFNCLDIPFSHGEVLQINQSIWENKGESIMLITDGIATKEQEDATTIIYYDVATDTITFTIDVEPDSLPKTVRRGTSIAGYHVKLPLTDMSTEEALLVDSFLDFIDTIKA